MRKSISKIALEKKEEYDRKYIDWCKETGSIMNGLSSMAMGARDAALCKNKEELKILYRIYVRKHKNIKGVNGWGFAAKAMKEILNEYNKQFKR